MMLKLLVLMVAVAVLEGVAGLQDEQFANETQIEANPDHKKRARRLDKLPCIMMEGKCQKIGDYCDGVVRQGSEWCLHDRYFECCYPKGCEMDGVVCPNGALAVKCCSILKCENGDWILEGEDPNCCPCHATDGTTIKRYEEIGEIIMKGHNGVYPFSWYQGPPISPVFGIDIVLGSNGTCITDASYCENGVTVNIWFNPNNPGTPEVSVSDASTGETFSMLDTSHLHQLPLFVPPVYISCDATGIYIFGNHGLCLCINWNSTNPWCAENVYAYADTSVVSGHLNGLCGDIINDCQPRTNRKKDTPDTDKFINSLQRSLKRIHLKKDQAIIESSMSEIEKSCEELTNGPCVILTSEECEKLKEECVSRMRNVNKPGQGSFIDSTE